MEATYRAGFRPEEEGSGGSGRFRAEVTAFVAFVTREQAERNVRVEVRRCEAQERQGAFFRALAAAR